MSQQRLKQVILTREHTYFVYIWQSHGTHACSDQRVKSIFLF